MSKTQSLYLHAQAKKDLTAPKARSVSASLFSLLSLALVGFIVLGLFAPNLVAQAADNAEDDLIQNAFDEFGVGTDNDGFMDAIDKASSDNPASFGYIVDRLFSPGYINRIDKAVVASGLTNALSDRVPNLANPAATKYACARNATGAGTLVYHNCDVPNILTEFIQDAVSVIDTSGVINGERQSAYNGLGFGLPKNLPGTGTVPIKSSERVSKYTGLELYGYGLKFTSYGGEWDHIKTMTSARAMSNFGMFDGIKLGAKSIVNGITSGLNTVVNNLADKLTSGDIFGAIGSAYSGFVEGAASGGLVTILDTSDLNVLGTYSWYRSGFGGTTYGARELTDTELSAQARTTFLSMLTSSSPDNAGVDEELMAIRGGLPDPLEAISSCSYTNSSGNVVSYGNTSAPPGPSRAACQAQANANKQPDKDGEIPPGDARINWDEEGTQELETLAEWKANNAATLSTAASYGMSCSPSTDESNRDGAVAALKACWEPQWQAAKTQNLIDNQTTENVDWFDNMMSPLFGANWMGQNIEANNFSAPWNRYVCTDANGKDLLTAAGYNIKVYDSRGNLNPACGHAVRPPIEGGLFGSGYTAEQLAGVAPDTRHISNFGGAAAVLTPQVAISNNIGNFFLNIAQFFTMVSNEIVSWTFSPILQSIGLDDLIVNFIEGFRDSLFFPLSTLVISIAGLYILWQTGVKRRYREQATSALLIAGFFVLGTVLMLKPEATVRLVDEVPATVEQMVIGSIYGVGNNPDDELCTATGSPFVDPQGPFGALSGFSPSASTRTLMCENWRAFVFSPWVQGQWGTSLDNLYAAGSGKANSWKNTNGALVGDAAINMGGGKTMKNWAIYQLDVLNTGTSTTPDLAAKNGVVPKDMYRIVDAQAGPNGGAGTDSRFFETWSGVDITQRVMAGLSSAVISGFGLVTVAAYSFAKIVISFVTMIMLLFLPFVFLMGLFPAKRGDVRKYSLTIVGLMIQRVVLVVVLAVFFKMLIGFANLGEGNFVMATLMCIVVCVAFLKFRKEIMNFAFSTVGGAPYGGGWVSNPGDFARSHTPLSVQQGMQSASTAVTSFTGGMIAGAMTGRNLRQSANEAWSASRQSMELGFRRRGFGLLQTAKKASKSVTQDVQRDLHNDGDFSWVRDGVVMDTDSSKAYSEAATAYSTLLRTDGYSEQKELITDKFGNPEYDQDGAVKYQHFIVDKNGARVMDAPARPLLKSFKDPSTTRHLAQARELHRKRKGLIEQRNEILVNAVNRLGKKSDQLADIASGDTEAFARRADEIISNGEDLALSEKEQKEIRAIEDNIFDATKKIQAVEQKVIAHENKLSGRDAKDKQLRESVANVREHLDTIASEQTIAEEKRQATKRGE